MNANVHHAIVIPCILYTIFNMCDRPFAMFQGDEMCLRTYKPWYSHLITVTFAYFFYDLLVQIFLTKDTSPLGKQNVAHHCITWVCFATALFGGYNMAMQAHISMICEFSQIFLNLRNALGKNSAGALALINSVAFFAAYTLCRIVLFPLLIVIHFQETRYYDLWNTGAGASGVHAAGSVSLRTQICWVLLLTFFLMICALNLFWYKLILRILYKTIRGGKKTSDGEVDEPLIARGDAHGSEV